MKNEIHIITSPASTFGYKLAGVKVHGINTEEEAIKRLAAHEPGHSVNLDHHSFEYNADGDLVGPYCGPQCIMRYVISLDDPLASEFCKYTTPSEDGNNFCDGRHDPADYGLENWNCASGQGNCFWRVRVKPLRTAR